MRRGIVFRKRARGRNTTRVASSEIWTSNRLIPRSKRWRNDLSDVCSRAMEMKLIALLLLMTDVFDNLSKLLVSRTMYFISMTLVFTSCLYAESVINLFKFQWNHLRLLLHVLIIQFCLPFGRISLYFKKNITSKSRVWTTTITIDYHRTFQETTGRPASRQRNDRRERVLNIDLDRGTDIDLLWCRSYEFSTERCSSPAARDSTGCRKTKKRQPAVYTARRAQRRQIRFASGHRRRPSASR